MEGFADYFAKAVARSVPEGTLTGLRGTPGASTLEQAQIQCPSLPTTIPGDAVELFVGGTLHDLSDQPGDVGSEREAHDTLARMDREIFEIFDRELDDDVNGDWPTITDFRDAWMSRGLPSIELSRIMSTLRIPLRSNYGPTANAGADQTVDAGAAVKLDGSASSDPDLNPLTFAWTQVSGPNVTLADASSATPSFTAPELSSGSTTLVFRLVVSDGLAPPSAPDEVAVQVVAPEDTTPPEVSTTTPTNGATGISRRVNLVANFSEKMNRATLNKSTFKLYKVNPNGTRTQITNVVVTPSLDGLKATLNPFGVTSTLLPANTKYRAIVTTGARDLAGNALDQNSSVSGNQTKAWTFTTRSS
jgi:hypothetical protein